MTMDEKVARINELYHKSKSEGLTEEEKAEQAVLRKEYIKSFRDNIRATLEHVEILEADGSVTKPGKNLKH